MDNRNNKVVNSSASETPDAAPAAPASTPKPSIPYTVKLRKLCVVAWCVQQDGEDGNIFMSPVTLPLDPREQDQDFYWQVNITASEDDCLEQVIALHTVMSVIPASATLQVKIVLCDKDGTPLYWRDKRVEWFLGFETIGSGYEGAFEEWRKHAEDRPEQYFGFYFDNLRQE